MDSPFSQYFHTNYIPSNSEIKRIQTSLTSYLTELSRLDLLIRDLTSRRKKLAEYVDSHRALISCGRRLPRDILQEIFTACLPIHRNAIMSAKEAPLLLCHVCSGWRGIAYSTGALWASLHLPLEFIFARGLHTAAIEWLARSAGCPLSISIVGSRNMMQWREDNPDYVDSVMEALVQSSARWRTAELSFNAEEGLFMLSAANSPRLEVITLGVEPSEMVSLDLLGAENLRSVTLNARHSSLNPFISYLPLNWDRLTHLSFGSPGLSVENVISVVRNCSRLTTFRIAVRRHRPNDVPLSVLITSSVVLSCLENLTILDEVDPPHVEFLVRQLQMPQLHRFEVPKTLHVMDTVAFLANLGKFSPLIEDFNIDLARLMRLSLSENLRQLDYLKTITVTDSWDPRWLRGAEDKADISYLISLLTPDPDSPLICPRLESLQIKEWVSTSSDKDSQSYLLEFAHRRLDASTNFRRLAVTYGAYVEPISSTVLQSFAARGLVITTSSTAHPLERSPAVMPWTGLEH
ncbi:hypothetical protein MVEN_00922600 [Mycena venus]|uniref:F-box domain-containing protein n=1 Tax=Mycena venus TaxID=2733690 RepID=A0A8H6YBI4_9AGAR|nr:hypothetical protein MVEN_00922600 [Mycena venus]